MFTDGHSFSLNVKKKSVLPFIVSRQSILSLGSFFIFRVDFINEILANKPPSDFLDDSPALSVYRFSL